MFDYRFEEYQSGVLLMAEYHCEDNHFRYLVYYPNANTTEDTYYTDWAFRREEINSHSSFEWRLDDKEKEEIKEHIRNVIKPMDLTENVQDRFMFHLEFSGRYLMKEEMRKPFEEVREYRNYYVDYPSNTDPKDINWHFFSMIKDADSGIEHNDCLDWDISEKDQEEIKSYIRTVLKPNDYNEFNFVNDISGRVRVKSIEVDGGYVDYYVDYPCKQEGIENWKFYIGKDNNTTNGEFVTENWDISNLEAEYLKSYIRNVLKPSDLCESEEKEMENTIISVAVPSEVAEEVMSIISRYEGVPVEKNSPNVADEFEQTKELTVSEYDRMKDVMIDKTKELEQCETDKKIVVDELFNAKEKTHRIINNILTALKEAEQNEMLEEALSYLSDEDIKYFDLEKWKEEKYDIVTVEVTQTRTKEIKVVVPHDSYSESDIDNFIERDCCNSLDDIFNDVDEYEYEFSSHSSYDSNLTAKEIAREYGVDKLFPGTSEIEDEVF